MDSHTDSVLNRLDVVDTGRRRRWSDGEKKRIVLESMAGPRQISATAHRSQPALNRGAGRRRSRDEHAASQNAWMENTDRGARSVPRSAVCDARVATTR